MAEAAANLTVNDLSSTQGEKSKSRTRLEKAAQKAKEALESQQSSSALGKNSSDKKAAPKGKPKKKKIRVEDCAAPSSRDAASSSDNSDSDSSVDSVREIPGNSRNRGKPYLEVSSRAITSTDATALLELRRKFCEFPIALGKMAKGGGSHLRGWYEAVKLGISQMDMIRKSVDMNAADAQRLKRHLKKAKSWFSETFCPDLGPDGLEAGYLDSFRCELAEELPTKIFGASNIRKLRTKIKSFQNQNKLMKNSAASTLYNWQIRKRGWAATAPRGDRPKFEKKQKFGGHVKKFLSGFAKTNN